MAGFVFDNKLIFGLDSFNLRKKSFLNTSFAFLLGLLPLIGVGQTATITITQSSSGITAAGYDSGAERTWTQGGVSFGAKAVFKESGQTRLQFQAANGLIYNTTAFPGRIVSITINQTNTNTSTCTGGTARLVNNVTGNYTATGTAVGSASSTGWTSASFTSTDYTFFAIKRGTGASYSTSIAIEYELPTVTFNKNAADATGTMTSQYASVSTPLTSNSFSRAGYTFTGWNTVADGSGTAYANGANYPFSASTTLYAQWASAGYTVTFNANSGAGAMSNQTASSATSLTVNSFTRSGYTFAGWNTASGGGGTAYADGATYPFTSNTTLYAQWTAISGHTVIFNANGGSGTMGAQNASSSTVLTSNAFTRTGYTFSGWNTVSNGSGTAYADGVSYSFAADLTLYAQWTANNNTITFNANGGAGSMSNQTIATAATATLTANAFTRAGYTFSGWNTASNGSGTAYANSASYTIGTSNVTLYAQWTAINYTITFDPNGGTGSMSSQTIASGVTASLTSNAYTRAGYTFSGWATTVGGAATYADGASYTMGTASVTLYAQWTVYVGPCESSSFPSSSLPSGWSGSSANATTSAHYQSAPNTRQITSSTDLITPSVNTPSSIRFYVDASGSGGQTGTLSYRIGSGSWVTIGTFTAGTTGTTEEFLLTSSPNLTATSNVSFRFTSSANSIYIDDVEIFCTPAVPALTATPASLSGMNYTVGFGPSASQTFVLTGSGLDGSNVEMAVIDDHFEISENNTSFSGYINLSAYAGSSKTIYVRLKSGKAIGGYADVILITGGGVASADEPEVNLSGNVTAVVAPVITSSTAQSVVYGSTVSYQITASNTPTSFNATTLPAGLSVNTSTGLISGTITEDAGSVVSNISASNTGGTDSKTLTWTITPKPLTVTGLSAASKVYDGNATASLSGTASLNGIVGTDAVTLAGTATAVFSDKNAANNKTITVSGYTLSGAKAGNYTLIQPAGLTSNITPKSLSITAPSIASKVYDGSSASGTITTGTLSGFVGTETVTATASGTYPNADAELGKTATITYVLANGTNGGLAMNYSLAVGTGTGDITKANPVITTSAITLNVGAVYGLPGTNISSNSGGTITYSISAGGNATLSGVTITGAVIGTETLTVNQAATANYNAGTTTLVVNVVPVTFSNGDYRSTGGGTWHSTAGSGTTTWQQYSSGSWGTSLAPATNNTTNTIYIRHSISLVGTNSAKNIVIESGGILSTGTVTPTFKNLLVKTGGIFNKESNGIKFDSDGILEVQDGATFTFKRTSTTAHATNLWAGTEKFHPNSDFIVLVTDNAGGDGNLVTEDMSSISSYNGALFGNFIIDMEGNGRFPLFPPSITANKLTAGDFIFRHGVDSRTITTGSYSIVIGGNLIIENTYNQVINLNTASTSSSVTVNGDFTHNGTAAFRVINNATGSSTLNVNGNTQINSGILDVNFTSGGAGTVNMKGNFTVATGATYTATNSTTATTIFSGGNVQDVSGAGTINVYYMEVNKTGGKVNLLRDLQSKINLKMVSGHVYTNANLFELGENTTQKGTLDYNYTTGGYVVGKMRRWFNGTNSTDQTGLFPMGHDESGLKNRFGRIFYTAVPTGGNLTVQFIGSAMGMDGIPIASPAGGFGAEVNNVEDQGFWTCTAATLAGGTYTASFTGEGFSQIVSLGDITLVKRMNGSSPWETPGTHIGATGTLAVPVVTRTGLTGFSDFGFGSKNLANPLPIELLHFSATCTEKGTSVKWSTASEKNSDYFALEVSRDLNDWSTVTELQSSGNSAQVLHYEYTDINQPRGTSYYRLVQVDLNGEKTTYNPASADCSSDHGDRFMLYPNPSSGNFTVEWNDHNFQGEVELRLTAATGMFLGGRKVKAGSGTNLVQFSEALPAGVYYVTILGENAKAETLKLVVK